MASRALAPSRTASDILMGVLAPSADSSSTSSVVALATRGVTSTHTPVGFWFHQRLCATKVPSASSSSYTAYPLITSQPHACWAASALANEFSTSMLTAALTLDRSSLLGPAVRRQRLPASCFLPRKAFITAFSLKHAGHPEGGETIGAPAASDLDGSEQATSLGSGQ